MTKCSKPLRIALIGCGALAELYYGPALGALSTAECLEVTALIDPCGERLSVLGNAFPGARLLASLEKLEPGAVDLAIVASPQRFHAEQTISLFKRGLHVLCEKPMASNAAEARAMIAAAKEADRLLSVGLFRRFFPTSQFVSELIAGGALGRTASFEWAEGGSFNWPAASPSFFQKAASSGGVFADIGTHVIDLLLWWFGAPVKFDYEDDALGGLEANARVGMHFSSGVTGTLRLSRDTNIPNGTRIRFERGSIWFQGASADSIVLQIHGCSYVSKGVLHGVPPEIPGIEDGFGPAARTYSQSFMEQILNFCRAIRNEEPLRVTGEQALRGMELIERCYAARRVMSMPWMTREESEGAFLNRG